MHATLDDATLTALRALSGDDLLTRPVDLAAMAHDASHYLLHPRAVVTARDAAHVAALMRLAGDRGLPLTFRSGGTSLSGQAGGEGLLVDVRRGFRDIEVFDDGARVRVRPGATVRMVNAHLARHGRKLGPDPASEAACTIGGVIANNSSGMACGIEQNAYRTVDSMVFALPSGTVVDTARPDADARLRAAEPHLWDGLVTLRDRIREDAESVARVRHQFSMKNTMGYSLNAFLDHDAPAEILAHLMIGSEGTLGFVAEAVFRTVPLLPHLATALLVLDTLEEATDALAPLVAAGARTVELMDAAALRVVQRGSAVPAALAGLEVTGHTALLVELQAPDEDALAEDLDRARAVLAELPLSVPARFTSDAAERAALWHVRKGLYTAVAGARPAGTTALLEDVVVPLPELTATTQGLIALFARHGYDDAVIFGHAKDGNLHFMITPSFDDAEELGRYERFSENLVDLVLAAGGSLKAEHGTGRIMAPYVRRQYGDELHAVMREVKRLCDPRGLLNPGVVLTDDPASHLAHLKVPLAVDERVDACVECGYCEPVCPSRDVTTTPRQRIVLMREIAAAERAGDGARAAALRRDFDHAAVQTCATDSLCVTACPVDIDTGAAMKTLRAEGNGALVQRGGRLAAEHWAGAVTGLRGGLRVAEALPGSLLAGITKAARTVLPHDLVPEVGADLPGPGPARPRARRDRGARAVLFPACIDSLFGPADPGRDHPGGATAALRLLSERAGLPLAVPDGVAGLCCGTPWRSKGLTDGYTAMAARTFQAIWEASDGGALPVICEASSCGLGLRELGEVLTGQDRERHQALTILDAVSYVRAEILPRLDVPVRLGTLALHPTCASHHLGSAEDLAAVAAACAEEVTVPLSWGCCGFAGDRGLLHPELTAAATAPQAVELAGREFDAYVSSNRTCEMGMSRATGRTYRHVLELLEELTRPAPGG